jgi:outer membrane protein OmpA-like peptidoglycan-associated protein
MASRHRVSEDFSHSITDLMTSIAVVFVLLFLFFAQEQRDKAKETKDTVTELLEALEEEFGKIEIDLARREGDPLTLEVTLPEGYGSSLNFAQNDAALLPAGKELLDQIVPKLLRILCSDEFLPRMDSVVIEGHSSTEGKERRNVELSAQRATAVLLYSLDTTTAAHERRCLQDLVTASGRGAWHPKYRESGGEDPEASRRVVFRMRVKSLEQREERLAEEGLPPADEPSEASVLGGVP